MGSPWKQHELEIIAGNRDRLMEAATYIAGLLPDRMPSRIMAACMQKIDRRKQDKIPWTEEEAQFLRANAASMSIRAIAEHLGMKTGRVITKVRNLGIATQGRVESRSTKWTPELIAELKNEAPTIGMAAFGKKHHISWGRVREKVIELGLPRFAGGNQAWSDTETDALRKLAETMTFQQIAAVMGRSTSGIQHKCQDLNIKTVDGRLSNRPAKVKAVRVKRERPALKPQVRKVVVTAKGNVYYCPDCHCPVTANTWQGHYQRTGHRPSWMRRAA